MHSDEKLAPRMLSENKNAGTTEHNLNRSQKLVTLSALLGNTMEYYDFFLFSTAAALVFGSQFFSFAKNSLVGQIASYALLFIGFLARPVGGYIFGRWGDKVGRKNVLVASITTIGLATGTIGCIPNYASIGIAAPLLLLILRLVQGLALGGEWAGSLTMTAEHIKGQHAARLRAIPLMGSALGTFLSTGAFLAVQRNQQWFIHWGWRVPFLLAFPLLVAALIIRWLTEESPDFRDAEEQGLIVQSPVRHLITQHWRGIIFGALLGLVGSAGWSVAITVTLDYGAHILKINSQILLIAQLLTGPAELVTIIIAGLFAQRWGAIAVALGGAVLTALLAFPAYYWIDSKDPWLYTVAVCGIESILSTPFAVLGSILPLLFPTSVRYSGVALANNLTGIVSGLVPIICTSWLHYAHSSSYPLALTLVILSVLTCCGAVGCRSVIAHRSLSVT